MSNGNGAVPIELARFVLAAEATLSEEGTAGAFADAPQDSLLQQIGAAAAENFLGEFPEFASVDGVANGFTSMLRDVAGTAFFGFVDEGPLNDLQRIANLNAIEFVGALLASPALIIFGLVKLKIERVLDLLDQGKELLEELVDDIAPIQINVQVLDIAGILLRNAGIVAIAVPIAKLLKDNVDELLRKAEEAGVKDFSFNVPGITLAAICATLKTLSRTLTGSDVQLINVMSVLGRIQIKLGRLISIVDEIILQISQVPDFKGNLERSRRSQAALRASELAKLRQLLTFFIDLGEAITTTPDFRKAQQALSMGVEFARISNHVCQDVKSLADTLKDTVENLALDALNAALAKIDLTPLQEIVGKIRSFIAIAQAAVTQNLGARFEDEFIAVNVAINGALLLMDLIRTIFGGFPAVDTTLIRILVEGIEADGLDGAAAALTGSGEFDSIATSSAALQSSAGSLVDFLREELERTDIDDFERAELQETRDLLIAFERNGAGVGRAVRARGDLDRSGMLSFKNDLRRIQEVVLRVTVKRAARAAGVPA